VEEELTLKTSVESNGNGVDNDMRRWKHESDSIREQLKYAVVMDTNSSTFLTVSYFLLTLSFLANFFLH